MSTAIDTLLLPTAVISGTDLYWSGLHKAAKIGTISQYLDLLKDNNWVLLHCCDRSLPEIITSTGATRYKYRNTSCELGVTVLSTCINNNNINTLVDVLELSTLMAEDSGCNAFHRAAINNNLDCLSNFITSEVLTTKTSSCTGRGTGSEKSVAILAAECGSFSQIPMELITEALLGASVDCNDNTLYHILALKGDLNLIPAEFVEKNILRLNKAGESPLHFCASSGNFKQVPESVLSPELLECASTIAYSAGDSMSPLLYAVETGHADALYGIDFSEAAKLIVGEEWWAKNQMILQNKANLAEREAMQELAIF